MKIKLSILLFLLLFSFPVFGADLELIRDLICSWETRGIPELQRDDAIGDSSEIGRCQIKPKTARLIGYRGTNQNLLSIGWMNRIWALEYVRYCARRRGNWAYAIAKCYNGGPNATTKSSYRYARQIASDYAMIILLRNN